MRAPLAPPFNYRKELALFWRGRHRLDGLSCQHRVNMITNGPHTISNADGLRWRHLKSLMDAAKIVVSNVQRDRRNVVVQLL